MPQPGKGLRAINEKGKGHSRRTTTAPASRRNVDEQQLTPLLLSASVQKPRRQTGRENELTNVSLYLDPISLLREFCVRFYGLPYRGVEVG